MNTKPTVPRARCEDVAAQVYDLARNGISKAAICSYLGFGTTTFENFYAKDFRRGKTETDLRVRKFLIQNATGDSLHDGATHSDCIRAATFWAKTQMGFRETQAIEHSSPDGSMSPKAVDPAVVSSLLKKLID